MHNALVFLPESPAPLWPDLICAVELGDGLLCFLSPDGAGPAPGCAVSPGDELLLRRPGEQRRVRVELVRQAQDGPSWICFVVRPWPAQG
jgi:hypothetical protein